MILPLLLDGLDLLVGVDAIPPACVGVCCLRGWSCPIAAAVAGRATSAGQSCVATTAGKITAGAAAGLVRGRAGASGRL